MLPSLPCPLAFYTLVTSGVGTVAAVAALAATLFGPQINIHNLLIAKASLVPDWERAQPQAVSLLHQSHVQLHAYIST